MTDYGTRQDERDRPEQDERDRPEQDDADFILRELTANNEHLSLAISGVSGLLAGALDLDVLLTRVAQYAVQAIAGAEGAGVTMFGAQSHTTTFVASDEFVKTVDEIQYKLNEGPCVSAAADGHTIRAGALGNDDRWPRFGPRAARLGVHSALSVPMLLPDTTLGVINIYARVKGAFGAHA